MSQHAPDAPPPAEVAKAFTTGERLPDHLPGEPFAHFESWFREARDNAIQPNPNAMTLATVDPDGRPSSRIVLCKSIEREPGCVVFYTNYTSRKGRALGANPRASLTFHWDPYDRQVRVEGPVTRTSEDESDAYFRTRAWQSRVGAWASDQSEPIESRQKLLEQVAKRGAKLGVDVAKAAVTRGDIHIPRPPHWGGFRVWAERVELWCGGVGRVHDRAHWTRELTPSGEGFSPGPWSATRLQP